MNILLFIIACLLAISLIILAIKPKQTQKLELIRAVLMWIFFINNTLIYVFALNNETNSKLWTSIFICLAIIQTPAVYLKWKKWRLEKIHSLKSGGN